MKQLLLLGAFLAAGTLGLQSNSAAHGGTYRGPGDTVPPGGGGSGGGPGPQSPGPGPAGTPGEGQPAGPRGVSPGGTSGQPGQGAAAATRGGESGPDLTVWQFWWGFNKDPYLNLKAKIHASTPITGSDDHFLGGGAADQAKDRWRPTVLEIRETVVPALLRALTEERSNDILTGAMIALAKIGDRRNESGESEFEPAIARFLSDSNQEVGETAALALGILANEASIPTLVDLMRDTPAGRQLVGSTEVPYRTRSFATFGLGLIGNRTSDNARRQEIAEHLIDILEAPQFSTRNLKVAAMTALGLTPVDDMVGRADISPPAEGNGQHVVSRQAQIRYLIGYFDESEQREHKRTRHWFVRSHAPTALARLLSGTHAPELKAEVVGALQEAVGRHSKTSRKEIHMSCALALGQLGDWDGDGADATIRAELVRLLADGDLQTRRFALIALGRSGSNPGSEAPGAGASEVRRELLKQMSKGKTQMKPWAALALGVFGNALIEAGLSLDPGESAALRVAAADCRRPSEIGAYLIALGLRRDQEAQALVLEKMEHFKGADEARGLAAVALGLMGAKSAIEPIQMIIRSSKYRPDLLKQAAIGLGLLGDKELVPELIAMLKEAKGLATQAALSSALGAIGDSRSIEPLVAMLADRQLSGRARGFAAVALGIVCDKEPLPWVSKISTNINYRANTVTLTDGATGILDIL